MKTFDHSLASHYQELLALRERELCAVLRAREAMNGGAVEAGRDVANFAVDEAQAEQAALELEEVLAALFRIKNGTYGRCVECDDAIAPGRLAARPATPYCTECQTLREATRHVAGWRRSLWPPSHF
jgi:DnaK suppressor protein